MVRMYRIWVCCGVLSLLCSASLADKKVISAFKDSFMRSNEQIRGSGGSEYLIISHVNYVRSLISFNLSGITNRIENAEVRIYAERSIPTPVSVTLAAMVHTPRNAAWGEGRGKLGAQGQNSPKGIASFIRSAAPDVVWETQGGLPANSLLSDMLWERSKSTLHSVRWNEGEWITFPLSDLDLLNRSAKDDVGSITFGLWGHAGNGTYYFGSRESDHAPQLVLTLKEDEGGN